MKNIIAYFIKYSVSGWVLLGLLAFFGYMGMHGITRTFFPNAPTRLITVTVTYPGASPEEVEEGIVIKIEDNLKGVSGIEKVSSVSQENLGVITIELIKGFNEAKVLDDVKNAIDQINSFPVGMEPPVVVGKEALNKAMSFAISGNVPLKTLKTIARRVEDELRAKPFISKVELTGFPDEEIEVSLNEDALRSYDLTLAQVMQAIGLANVEVTGGIVQTPQEDILIRSRNKGYYAADLKTIFLKTTADGRVIRLEDVADVHDRWADSPVRDYLNGEPSVVVTIQNTVDEDLLVITNFLHEYINEFNEDNQLVQASVIEDESVVLNQRIALLTRNGIIGFILVLIILAAFIDWRIALWVAFSIPVSFAGMFVLAHLYGLTINVISLFGMILVVGILVDDGIVIAENIYQYYEKGVPPFKAAVQGTIDVLPAVASSVLTTIVAFSTFFFIDGRLGDIAPDMAFVVMATLTVSLIEGALLLPAHLAHSRALHGDTKPTWIERRTTSFMAWMKDRVYAPILRFMLKYPAMGVAIPVALFLITMGALSGGFIKTTFFPNIERNDLTVNLELPAGTQESITDSILSHIEDVAWQVNDSISKGKGELFGIENYSMIETMERTIGPQSHVGALKIILVDAESRDLQSFDVANIIREAVGPIYQAEKLSYEVRAPFGKAISVTLMGNDLIELDAAKQELMDELNRLATVKNVVSNDQVGMREVNIKLKDKAYLLGLNVQSIMSQVRQGFFGGEVQRLQRGIDEVKVWVRYAEDYRDNVQSLEDMRIRTADGKQYPLSELVTFTTQRGVIGINHLDGKRSIKVEGDVSNPKVSVVDVMDEIRTAIVPEILKKYPDVTARYEGQSEQSAKTTSSAKVVLWGVFAVMLAIIALTFRSAGQAIVVFMMVPFGFIGVAFGHWVHATPISLLSFFGIIGLLGIMVNDSLVLVSAYNQLLQEGRDMMDAVYEAAVSRFRPILLTSLTTIAGLAPLIMERSFQAQFLIPMAISIAYGLMVATFITLLLLPVSLVIYNRFLVYVYWLWWGKKPANKEVEHAYQETLETDYEDLV